MALERLKLVGDRGIVRQAEPADAPAIVKYYEDNRTHLGPWEPNRPAAWYSEAHWENRVLMDQRDFAHDVSLRTFIFDPEADQRVLGVINFGGFMRGPFQACFLGYGLAHDAEGRGVMYEALCAAIDYAFDVLNFHRIQANYMPHNQRSGALLRRLGFVPEGYARDYLFLNGAWQDHVLTSLTHPDWRPPV